MQRATILSHINNQTYIHDEMDVTGWLSQMVLSSVFGQPGDYTVTITDVTTEYEMNDINNKITNIQSDSWNQVTQLLGNTDRTTYLFECVSIIYNMLSNTMTQLNTILPYVSGISATDQNTISQCQSAVSGAFQQAQPFLQLQSQIESNLQSENSMIQPLKDQMNQIQSSSVSSAPITIDYVSGDFVSGSNGASGIYLSSGFFIGE